MSTTPKTAPTQEEVTQAVEFLSTAWGQGRDTTRFTASVDVVLSVLAAKERECEELRDDAATLAAVRKEWMAAHEIMGFHPEGPLVAMEEQRDAATARAEKAEARVKELEKACRYQVENIERWLKTGEPAGPEESKAIYEQLKVALRAVEG